MREREQYGGTMRQSEEGGAVCGGGEGGGVELDDTVKRDNPHERQRLLSQGVALHDMTNPTPNP